MILWFTSELIYQTFLKVFKKTHLIIFLFFLVQKFKSLLPKISNLKHKYYWFASASSIIKCIFDRPKYINCIKSTINLNWMNYWYNIIKTFKVAIKKIEDIIDYFQNQHFTVSNKCTKSVAYRRCDIIIWSGK